jgi:hypothetical protein
VRALSRRGGSAFVDLRSRQSRCFPTLNSPASSPEDPARRLCSSSRPTHARNSLCLLLSPSSPFFSRAYIPRVIPTAYLTFIVFGTSYSATNSVVFAQYVLSFFDLPITGFSQTVLALSVATVSVGGNGSDILLLASLTSVTSCCHLHQVVTESCKRTEHIQGTITYIVGNFHIPSKELG